MMHDPLPWPSATDRPSEPAAREVLDLTDMIADVREETLAAEARRTVLISIAGLIVGLAIVAVIDWISTGPGLRVMVGF